MELVKNIFFNTDKLTPFSEVKISYTGKFFEDKSKKVFIRYGFGTNWENGSDIEMCKTELGFQAEIKLLNEETFNFCFYNENYEWDNNDEKNYVFTIESADLDMVLLDESILYPKSKFYLWKKKFKVTIYKVITYIPNLILGKYKRKPNEENEE